MMQLLGRATATACLFALCLPIVLLEQHSISYTTWLSVLTHSWQPSGGSVCSPAATAGASSAACLSCCAGCTQLAVALPDTVRGRDPSGGVLLIKLVSLDILLLSMGKAPTRVALVPRTSRLLLTLS